MTPEDSPKHSDQESETAQPPDANAGHASTPPEEAQTPGQPSDAAGETSAPATGDAAATPRRRPPLLRIVLFAVLGGAVVLLLLDLKARHGARTAYEKIISRLSTEEDSDSGGAYGEMTTREVVKELAGREPDGPGLQKSNELYETYSWRGAFRKYTVYVAYRGSNTPLLHRATLNEPMH